MAGDMVATEVVCPLCSKPTAVVEEVARILRPSRRLVTCEECGGQFLIRLSIEVKTEVVV